MQRSGTHRVGRDVPSALELERGELLEKESGLQHGWHGSGSAEGFAPRPQGSNEMVGPRSVGSEHHDGGWQRTGFGSA